MDDLEKRILRLERRNQLLSVALATVVVAVLAAGACQTQVGGTVDVLRARSFELVDSSDSIRGTWHFQAAFAPLESEPERADTTGGLITIPTELGEPYDVPVLEMDSEGESLELSISHSGVRITDRDNISGYGPDLGVRGEAG